MEFIFSQYLHSFLSRQAQRRKGKDLTQPYDTNIHTNRKLSKQQSNNKATRQGPRKKVRLHNEWVPVWDVQIG